MLSRCQSTRTAKYFYQQLPGWLLLCAWHKLPCEEHRLLLAQCQTPAANQSADMEKMWAHRHPWLARIGTNWKSPAVRLDGTIVSGKSPPSVSSNSCSAAGNDTACLCVHVCAYITYIITLVRMHGVLVLHAAVCARAYVSAKPTFCTVRCASTGYLIQHDTMLKNTVFMGGDSQ